MLSRYSFALLAALPLSGAALAADLPARSAPTPAYLAPAPVFSWTGFYAGLSGGYGWGEGKFTGLECHCGVGAGISGDIRTTDPDGALLGGQVGYNHQIGSLVIGLEGNLAWSGMKGTVRWTADGDAHSATTKSRWLATVAPRVGYSIDRALVYVSGGVAWSGFKYGHTHDMIDMGESHAMSASKTRVGWMLGAGVEWAFDRNWSAKLEYNRIDFGSRSVTLTQAGTDHFARFKIRDDAHIIKAGVNYRFGG